MSIFKRLSVTLASRIDQVVGEIENHDAVINVTLTEMRKKVAEAKVRLNQVRREETRLKQEVTKLQGNTQRWRERAINSAKYDEAKALECIHRARQCEQQASKAEQTRLQYEESAENLAQDITLSEQRLTEIKQKQTIMRARQSTSAALHAATEVDNNTSRILDDTFDRWEINIGQTELAIDAHDSPSDIDAMEREFLSQEQQNELRIELATLLDEENNK